MKGEKKTADKPAETPSFVLGDRVKDVVSQIVGIAIARIEYLNGCIQWCVVPKFTPGALEVSSFYIDEVQLVKVDNGVNQLAKSGATEPKGRSFGANLTPPRYGSRRG
jgi:hypothetical protein